MVHTYGFVVGGWNERGDGGEIMAKKHSFFLVVVVAMFPLEEADEDCLIGCQSIVWSAVGGVLFDVRIPLIDSLNK